MMMALPFLPVNRIETAIDKLKDMEFDETSDYFEKTKSSVSELIEYFENTWLHGNFPPALWNAYNKSSHLTNNPNEGYNSSSTKRSKLFIQIQMCWLYTLRTFLRIRSGRQLKSEAV